MADLFPPDNSLATVQSFIATAAAGDRVIIPTVPSATVTWNGGVTISGITLMCAVQNGVSINSGVATTYQVTMTKHPTQVTSLLNLKFIGNGRQLLTGGSAFDRPYVVGFCSFQTDFTDTTSGRPAIHLAVNGGVLHHNTFAPVTASVPTANAPATNGDVFNIATTEDWTTAPTFGTLDTTGERNIYFEDNTFTNIIETGPDADIAARTVFRHNTWVDSSIVFHSGAPNDSSPNGGHRHFEIYQNTFSRINNTIPVNKWIWVRGGSGIITNNAMDRASSPDGSSYPNKNDIPLTVGCPGTYPIQYQIGQTNFTPESTPSRPLMIFGNIAGPHTNGPADSNFITVGSGPVSTCGNPGAYIQQGRDYVLSQTWAWTPYPYPHQLNTGGGGDVTAPVCTITTPTAGTTFSTGTTPITTVGGTASDAVGVTQVTWTNDRGGSGAATGTTTWTIPSIALLSGANVITVTARDAAGNAGSDVLTITLTGSATTYFVDQTAGLDTNNGTSLATAWKNCPGMASYTGSGSLVAGDTVFFDRADTWNCAAGNQGLWLVGGVSYIGNVQGTGSGKARIRATGQMDAGLVRFRDHASLTTLFEGFEVDGNSQVCNGVDINAGFFSLMNGATKRVKNCEVHHVFSRASLGQYSYGIIASNHGGAAGACANVEFIDCIVHDVSRDAICLYPGDESNACTLTTCLIQHCEAYNTGQDPDYFAGAGILVKGRVIDATIEYNYCHDVDGASIFVNSNETNHFGTGPQNIHIRYNIITNSTGNGAFLVYDGSGGTDPKDIKFYGNIVFNSTVNSGALIHGSLNGTVQLLMYNNTFFNAPVLVENSGAVFSPFEFRNNIVYYTGGIPLTDPGVKITAHSNNMFFRGSGTLVTSGASSFTSANLATYEATALSSDPTFTNTAALPSGFIGTFGVDLAPIPNGLSIQTGSPGVNAGLALAATYASSINSLSRPQGTSWDRGAYEISLSLVPPSPPTGFHFI